MAHSPRVCVLKTDGINCDEETRYAFGVAGGEASIVHVNELRERRKRLGDFCILAIPGGFSYGDDVSSGKILANELVTFFKDEIEAFVERGGLVIGICNGFQALDQAGLLPGRMLGAPEAALATNASGRFECRWVELIVEGGNGKGNPCVFLDLIEPGSTITLPVAHGEGRFWAGNRVMESIEGGSQAVLRYAKSGKPTQHYPENPNGAEGAIAGICDRTGRVFGLMPHPERFIMKTQYPNWRRSEGAKPVGLSVFESAVRYARNNL